MNEFKTLTQCLNELGEAEHVIECTQRDVHAIRSRLKDAIRERFGILDVKEIRIVNEENSDCRVNRELWKSTIDFNCYKYWWQPEGEDSYIHFKSSYEIRPDYSADVDNSIVVPKSIESRIQKVKSQEADFMERKMRLIQKILVDVKSDMSNIRFQDVNIEPKLSFDSSMDELPGGVFLRRLKWVGQLVELYIPLKSGNGYVVLSGNEEGGKADANS